MITHACVRYEDDHCQAIVPVSYVKDFKPKGLNDFDDRAKYSVRWTCGDGDSDDEDDQESYYKARILLLGVSKEDVAAKMARKRIRIKKVLHSESSEDEVPEKKQDAERQEKKQMKERQETSGKASLLRLLEKKRKKMDSANLEQNVEREAARQGQEELERHTKDKRHIKSLEKQLAQKEEELVQVRGLNMRLQDQLLKEMEDNGRPHQASHLMSTASSPRQTLVGLDESAVPKRRCLGELQPSKDAPLSVCRDDDSLMTAKEDMVDLGRGIFLASQAWEDVQGCAKTSIFVKELALALYGSQELMARSAKGRHSPRFPNQPKKRPISPNKLAVIQDCYKRRLREMGMPENLASEESKKKVTDLINEKIGDLRRRAKRAEEAAAAEAAMRDEDTG
ncbi:BEN domain-containing protein 5 isoform X2 [Ixodes scapularis]|uniref:BEN domain-containing protein 5 isoform X2 n=1 Tax=Ixodes scapularis TaxID=6945 RepID=UPI001A9D86BF|nr:BEN domain-containing protein 5 isoform X2 [Ixodes scapularis]XP_029829633.2 BEN domain-containing protein 5 isoform X2 [Ixodes scapularis]